MLNNFRLDMLFVFCLFFINSLCVSASEVLTLRKDGYYLESLTNTKIKPIFLEHIGSFGFNEKYFFSLSKTKTPVNSIVLSVIDRENHKIIKQKAFNTQTLTWMQGPMIQVFPVEGTHQVCFLTYSEENQALIPFLNLYNFETDDLKRRPIPTDQITLMLAPFEDVILIHQKGLSHFITYSLTKDDFFIFKPGKTLNLKLSGIGTFKVDENGNKVEALAVGQNVPDWLHEHINFDKPHVIFSQLFTNYVLVQVIDKAVAAGRTSVLLIGESDKSVSVFRLPDGSGRVVSYQDKLSYSQGNSIVTFDPQNAKMKTTFPLNKAILEVCYVF